MTFAAAIDVLERLAIPIGIAIAVLAYLLVPSLRKNFMDSYNKGKNMRERMTGKTPKDNEEEPTNQK
ncbi:MAG: hypothetical protein QGH60_23545 [Phycisphaerae bacterium]|jgi:hypothetical protein|nr:hypothetical protein [Phycisphaerae bacterium]